MKLPADFLQYYLQAVLRKKKPGCEEHAAMCSPAVLGGTFSMLRHFLSRNDASFIAKSRLPFRYIASVYDCFTCICSGTVCSGCGRTLCPVCRIPQSVGWALLGPSISLSRAVPESALLRCTKVRAL